MASTFYGLNIGWSALNAYSVSTNTAANNIANAKTPGYCKQVTNLQAAGALPNYNYGTLGSGVVAESITQLRNIYYDTKYWKNNSYSGQYEKKIYYMTQIENLFNDDAEDVQGFSSIYNNMFNSMESLKGDSGNQTKRTQFINDAQSLAEYFNSMYKDLQNMQADCNQEVLALVQQVNSYAQKIAVLNNKINIVELQGSNANELRDHRAYLIDQLSAIIPVETEEIKVKNSNDSTQFLGGTIFRVRVEGQLLVDSDISHGLEVYSRKEKVGQSDIDGLYDIRWSETGNDFVASSETMSGQLKAVLAIRDGNNKENFQGTVADLEDTTLIIKNPNITRVEALNMPSKGEITIANRRYEYDSFEMTVEIDEKGNENAVFRFELKNNDLSTLAGKVGRKAQIGESVDARGIPYYMAEMNEFLRSFCRELNDIQQYGPLNEKGESAGMSGRDAYGNPMGKFFVSINPDSTENEFENTRPTDGRKGGRTVYSSEQGNYYYMTAGNLKVNAKSLKDSNYFATSAMTDTHESKAELTDLMLKLKSDTILYRGAGGDQFLQYMITDISVDANEAEILSSNYADIASTIDAYRMSVSSVDEDEEVLDLIKFQNAYNLACKIISTMNEMYDRLITQTGV